MKIRNVLIILIICILIIIGSFIMFNQQPSQNQIRVGDISYSMPEGYHVENFEGNNDTLITSNNDKIFLAVYGKSNVNEYVNNYVDYKKENNTTVEISSFVINDMTIYKSKIPNDENTTHYWFEKGNKVYSIYSFVKNPKRDEVTMELINSIKDNSIKLF